MRNRKLKLQKKQDNIIVYLLKSEMRVVDLIHIRVLVLLFVLPFSLLKGQTLVGITNQTVMVNPSNTVVNGSTVSVLGKFKNTGTTTITDQVHVNLAIDTSTTGIPKYYWRSTQTHYVSGFEPDSTISFAVNDIASVANKYKGGGGGTIVIIWATVSNPTNSITTSDSATTTIFIIDVPIGIEEVMNFEQWPIQFKNPISEQVQLKYNDLFYTKVELMDVNGKCLEQCIYNKTLHPEGLEKGLYFLRFYTETGNYITKKIIIE